MKRKRIIILLAALALIAAAAWYWGVREKEQPLTLTTEHPHNGYIATSVMATGTIQPVDTVTVGAQVSGTIKKIYADFNSRVKKGALLAQIDPSLLTAQVQQVTATLQQARSNLAYQESNFNRQSQLYKAGAISKADLETAQNAYKAAQDQVKGTGAQVSAAQRNLSFTNIYSPIDGTVLSRSVSEGQTVASSFNTPTLFSIAKDLSKMQVRAAVDEADIGNVRQGERASFTVDAFPNDVFNGTVQEIRLQPTVSANVVTYVTIIDAPNNDLKLKPGMTANINIYTQEVNNALLIPAAALKYQPDATTAKTFKIQQTEPVREKKAAISPGKTTAPAPGAVSGYAFVWLQKGDSLIRRRIETGLTDDINVEVLKGLNETDAVITGQQSTPGTKGGGGTSSSDRSPFMPQRGGNRGGGGRPR
ncbi:efflux RND transporter periplasmic adaptor subunit [Niabella drilacis]|uniref:HlyD family secretion protein n=1 Tax=Niabella drilacis (strain DSM 25811 / CCM 8410 / CCUG 62505 / LMG 26954 / E90) TaxID=1285928 RepID=A0A1G6XV46_NIADE|nr:efflux RND transporter periplasmic adaptor subunit [Niabella drilacis]SDD82000.1 HlyD family secretion protein [Niabella drilacis]